jgi:hypothetical protein
MVRNQLSFLAAVKKYHKFHTLLGIQHLTNILIQNVVQQIAAKRIAQLFRKRREAAPPITVNTSCPGQLMRIKCNIRRRIPQWTGIFRIDQQKTCYFKLHIMNISYL